MVIFIYSNKIVTPFDVFLSKNKLNQKRNTNQGTNGYKWKTEHFQVHTSGKWFEFVGNFYPLSTVSFILFRFISLLYGPCNGTWKQTVNGLCFYFNSSPCKHKAFHVMVCLVCVASCVMNFFRLNNVTLFMNGPNR